MGYLLIITGNQGHTHTSLGFATQISAGWHVHFNNYRDDKKNYERIAQKIVEEIFEKNLWMIKEIKDFKLLEISFLPTKPLIYESQMTKGVMPFLLKRVIALIESKRD